MFTSTKLLGVLLVCSTFGIIAQAENQEAKLRGINKVMSKDIQKVLGVSLGVCSAYILYTALFQICLGSACGYASYCLLTNKETKEEKVQSL